MKELLILNEYNEELILGKSILQATEAHIWIC